MVKTSTNQLKQSFKKEDKTEINIM